jgi:hypothetical protein
MTWPATRSVAEAVSIPLAVPAMLSAFGFVLHRAITEPAGKTFGALRQDS